MENFGPEMNGVVETIKIFFAQRDFILNEIKKVRSDSIKAKNLKLKLKPNNTTLKKFQKVLKTLQ